MMKKIGNAWSYITKAFSENVWAFCPSGMIPMDTRNL